MADPRLDTVVDGRYRVLERLAEGSMGVVYRGERVPVGKPVAIKFLHAAFAGYSELADRFDRETHVLSKLAHPHCASVLDFGKVDGAPYIVMEFVAGRTLRRLIDDGPIDPVTALTLARQLAAGLAHAHAQGIVHRDIKPANLMITEEVGVGLHLWILDFGLARLRGAIGPNATASHIAVGTPAYMSPEQTVGGAVDARADIYAAGVVLFEMITGQQPFEADDTAALLGMHRGAPVPDLVACAPRGAAIPPGLPALVQRAMAKRPEDRFQSAIELADAIGAVLAGSAARAATVEVGSSQIEVYEDEVRPPRPRRSHARALVLLGVLAIVGAGAWYLERRRDAPSPAAPPAATATAKPTPPAPPAKPAPPAPPARPAPAAPPPHVDTVRDALALIKDGKREQALVSLRALEKSDPRNAQIPFLIGNLNLDAGAINTALDEYQRAIALEPSYRGNDMLDDNVIKLLGSAKTRARATAFVKKTLGKAAVPALRAAARTSKDPAVRKQAAALARTIR